MTTLNDFEREAGKLKWYAMGAAVLFSGIAFCLFAATGRLWFRGMPWVGPILLWIGTQFLLVAVRTAVSGRAALPQIARDGAAARCALHSALAVGFWIGFQRLTWTSLFMLPLYAAIENPVRGLLIPPPDGSYAPVPVTRWVAHVTLGELTGFALATAVRGLMH